MSHCTRCTNSQQGLAQSAQSSDENVPLPFSFQSGEVGCTDPDTSWGSQKEFSEEPQNLTYVDLDTFPGTFRCSPTPVGTGTVRACREFHPQSSHTVPPVCGVAG